MDKREVAGLLAINKANFPYAYRDMSKEEKLALVNSWELVFKDYPSELIQAAFMEALKVCRNPITIADIFERLNKIRKATEKTTEELWQEFLKAANRVSDLANGFYYNAASKNYPNMTQGQERRQKADEVFNNMDNKIKTYVGSVKRLIDFGNMNSQHLEQIIFPAFRRSMESLDGRQEVLSITNPMLLDNGGMKTKLIARFLEHKKPEVMASNTDYSKVFNR